jgi:fused signal recognition particle receptor
LDSVVLVGVGAVLIVVAILVVVFVVRRGGSTVAERPVDTTEPGLRARLSQTRSSLAGPLTTLFSSSDMDALAWDDLEEALIAADVGPHTSAEIVAATRAQRPEDGDQAREALERELVATMTRPDRGLHLDGDPAVVVLVGVNGTGKTTSIAKIARMLTQNGHSVVLGAADTYRAAADTQLRTWGDRVGVPVVTGATAADPASVAFEALERARADNRDVVIVDTAGRLHSQTNLMDELAKIMRVLKKSTQRIDEVLLVLDGTTGQNGIAQAQAFTDAVGVTGIVLTKLDGTARGGIAIAVEKQLDVPVKFIGVGEGMDDLIPFVPREFVEALIAR